MKLKYRFEIVDMDDECVAVPLQDGESSLNRIVKLNDTARDIFVELCNEITEDELVDKMLKKYPDVNKEEMFGYVHEFLIELRNQKFLL